MGPENRFHTERQWDGVTCAFIVKCDLNSDPVKFCEMGINKDIDCEGLATESK